MTPALFYFLADVTSLSIESLLTHVSSLGGTTIIAIGFYLMYTGKIVTRRELDNAEARAKAWQEAAWRSLSNNERLQATNREAVETVKQGVEAARAGENR